MPAVRSAIIGVLGLLGAFVLARFLHGAYPLPSWLLWTVLSMWGWQLFLATALLSFGHLVVVRLLGIRRESTLETAALVVPVGAVAFATGMSLGGLLGLFSPAFAVIWPATMLVAGLPAARPALRRWAAWQREPRPASTPASTLGMAIGVFGVLALALVYLGIFTPDAVSYDGAWDHLAIAQDYAREGRIVPFRAHWAKSLPDLGSLISTWSFLLPGMGPPPVRWMMALHTEFAFFLWTLVQLAAAIGWLLYRSPPPRRAWVALFLFPSIFFYDCNLGGAADHFLAFFALPIFLVAAETARTLHPRWWALLGIVGAGALLTKYQSAYLLVPAALLTAAALVMAFVRRMLARGRSPKGVAPVGAVPAPRPVLARLLLGPLIAAVCLLAITAPFFVRNWIYYGNPVYPLAQDLFPGSRPVFPGTPQLAGNILKHWGTRPPADVVTRITEALRMLFMYSFSGKGHSPNIGSLFTLSLPFLLFLPRARRIWLGAAVGSLALLLWAATYQVERNLQTFLPISAAVVGSVLVRAWELGWVARAGAAALVAVQIVWGADVAFSGGDRLQSAMTLIRSGIEKRADTRFDSYYLQRYVTLGRTLPQHAVVLLHDSHVHLGIDRPVLLDWAGFQGLIDYRRYRTIRDLWDDWKALGITHVVYEPGAHPTASKHEEVIFAAFIARYGATAAEFHGLRVFALPAEPPSPEAPYETLLAGVPGYADGLYKMEGLSNWEHMPSELQVQGAPVAPLGTTKKELDALLGRAHAALLGTSVKADSPVTTAVARQFQKVVAYPAFSVSIRTQ